MSFDTKESSTADGAPISLYEFVYGTDAGAKHFYTDADDDILFGGELYTAAPITKGNIIASGKLDRTNLKVKISKDLALADVFRGFPGSLPVSLTIREGHRDDVDNEFLAAWIGTVMGHSRTGQVIELTCEPVSSTLKRPGLRKNYQYLCPHVLYGAQCRANKALATTETTVAAISGSKLTPAAGWYGPLDPKKWVGGLVEWDAATGRELRSIVRVSLDGVLTLSGVPTDLAPADSIDVILGCDHTMADCATLHDNILNFGGCPWIPRKNPVKTNPFS